MKCSLLEEEELPPSLWVLWDKKKAGTTVWAESHRSVTIKKEGVRVLFIFNVISCEDKWLAIIEACVRSVCRHVAVEDCSGQEW